MKRLLVLLFILFSGYGVPRPAVKIVFYRGVPAQFKSQVLKALSLQVDSIYHMDVADGGYREIPKFAYYAPRQRYKADKLLVDLSNEQGFKIIGLSPKDISTKSGSIDDWGVFGLAFEPGKTGVVSYFRFQGKDRLLYYTVCVMLHELGHTLGLPHCPDTQCLMNAGDRKLTGLEHPIKLCDKCKKLLFK